MTSLPQISQDVLEESDEPQRRGFIHASYVIYDNLGSTDSVDKPAGTTSTPHKPPTSTPIPITLHHTAASQYKKDEQKLGMYRPQ